MGLRYHIALCMISVLMMNVQDDQIDLTSSFRRLFLKHASPHGFVQSSGSCMLVRVAFVGINSGGLKSTKRFMSLVYSEVGLDSLTTPSMRAVVTSQTNFTEIRVSVAKPVPIVGLFELFLMQSQEMVFGLTAHSQPRKWGAARW